MIKIINPTGTYIANAMHVPGRSIFPTDDGLISFTDRLSTFTGTFDASDLYILPGFVDVHIHGGNGFRLYGLRNCKDAEENLQGLARSLLKFGVTSFLPTTITEENSSIRLLVEAIRKNRQYKNEFSARILGIHSEGPFLSENAIGAHDRAERKSVSRERLHELEMLMGRELKILTAAPEEDPDALLTDWAAKRNVVLSIGHSAAGGEEYESLYKGRYTRATHIFNAMPSFGYRSDSLALALLNDQALFIELIADGHMVHPRWARLAIKLAGETRIVAISDAIHASGMNSANESNGQCMFCGTSLARTENGWNRESDNAVWAPDKLLSSAIALMADGSTINWNLLVSAVSRNPMISAGLSWSGIVENAQCDVVALSQEGNVEATFLGGNLVFARESHRLNQ